MESRTTSSIFLLLALCFVTILCTDGPTQCTTDTGCFPYGPKPRDVTNKNVTYYCCMDSNRTKNANKLADGTFNCSCMLNLTLEHEMQRITRESRHIGRMCLREKDCKGATHNSTADKRYKFCCFRDTSPRTGVYMYFQDVDADKDEYLLCRCGNTRVPTPKPKAYVVPPVPRFNSTGEVCSYDEGCKSRPSLKCESLLRKNVTFCCYGSRGLVTENDGSNFTRCTCTDEVFGDKCASLPIAIEDSTMPCLKPADNCTDSSQTEGCCDYNMVPEVTGQAGSKSCKCKVNLKANQTGTGGVTRHVNRLNDIILMALATLLLGNI